MVVSSLVYVVENLFVFVRHIWRNNSHFFLIRITIAICTKHEVEYGVRQFSGFLDFFPIVYIVLVKIAVTLIRDL